MCNEQEKSRMKTTKLVKTQKQELVSITCDKCTKVYMVEDDEKDCRLEIQEFHTIRFRGGYGSVFGDETEVQCDICQHCLYEMIKDFMVTVTSNQY